MVEIIIQKENVVVSILKDKSHSHVILIQGGRQYDDEGRKRDTDDYPPRRSGGGGGGGGGQDRDRYGGPSRRDYDSNRSNKSNPSEKGMD